MNDRTRGTMQRLIYTHLFLFLCWSYYALHSPVQLPFVNHWCFPRFSHTSRRFLSSFGCMFPLLCPLMLSRMKIMCSCDDLFSNAGWQRWPRTDDASESTSIRRDERRLRTAWNQRYAAWWENRFGTLWDFSLEKAIVETRLLDRKANVVLLVYREGNTKRTLALLDRMILLFFSSPGQNGQNGRDGIDGIRGEMGFHGPPGRKVSQCPTIGGPGYLKTLSLAMF